MLSFPRWFSRTAALCALVGAAFLVFVAIAFASVTFTYAQGINGVGGRFNTVGYAPRDFNKVWHEQGYLWGLYYCTPQICDLNEVTGTANPTLDSRNAGYAMAFCHNHNDNSTVIWTCQTTHT